MRLKQISFIEIKRRNSEKGVCLCFIFIDFFKFKQFSHLPPIKYIRERERERKRERERERENKKERNSGTKRRTRKTTPKEIFTS